MRKIITENQKESIKNFWQWFESNECSLFHANVQKGNPNYAFSEISKALGCVDKDLTFEISPENAHKRTLTISADGDLRLFPLVLKMKETAPSNLLYWNVTSFRQPKKERIGISIGGLFLNYEAIKFEAELIENGFKLRLYIHDFDHRNPTFIIAANILLDSLIGEYHAALHIRKVSFYELKEGEKKELEPFENLRKLVHQFATN